MTGRDSASLRALAQQCRCLARGVSTPGTARSLEEMAADYDRKADEAAAREAGAKPASAPASRPLAEGAD